MESDYHNHHRNLYYVDCVWCSNFRQKKEWFWERISIKFYDKTTNSYKENETEWERILLCFFLWNTGRRYRAGNVVFELFSPYFYNFGTKRDWYTKQKFNTTVKKIQIDLNFFADNHIIKKKKWKVIIMLKKFSVENFKGFKDKITLDIGTPSNYSFNSEIIENGCITKGIIYGINSCGKSNLG